MRKILIASVVALLVPFHADASNEAAEAFYIQPMEFHIRPDVKTPSILEVFNKEEHTAQIHVDVFERSDTVDGAEKRTLTEDVAVDVQDFQLAAGESRKLQLRYRGAKKMSRERAYRIVVRQVSSGEIDSLDVRFVYVASMYVTPKQAESKLVVKGVNRASEREVEVTLMNEGKAHAQMSDVGFVVLQGDDKGPKREIALSSESRENWSRQNLLAGSRRKVKLKIGPSEKPVAAGGISVKLVKRVIDAR